MWETFIHFRKDGVTMKQRYFGLVAVCLTLMLCAGGFADTIDLSSQGYNHNVVAGASYVTVISFDYNTGGNSTTVNFRSLKDDGGDSWMMPVSFTNSYIEVDSDYGPYRYTASLSGTHSYVFTLNRFNGLWTLSIDGSVVNFVATSSTSNPQPDGTTVTAGAVVSKKYFSDETAESGQNAMDLGWADAVSGIGSAGAYKIKFPQASGSYIEDLTVTPMSNVSIYYDFDNVGATVIDGSGGAYNATVHGDVTGNIFGRRGGDAVFGGVKAVDYLSVPAIDVSKRATTQLTVAAWCKLDNTAGRQTIWHSFGPKPSNPAENGHVIQLEVRQDTGNYRFVIRNAESQTIGDFNPAIITNIGEWFHIA
ncbi:MAG TPA: hypothetical protein PLP05_12020, partial [Sedimentisphaerales bacterium]|nr:hypothetical protein [Sedimentisphaerales bacterium]